MMSIEQEVSNWDGKSSNDIAAVYESYRATDDFIENISILFNVVSLQVGLSWLVKRHLELGNKISKNQSTKILEQLPGFEHWEAKLNILQCLSHMEITGMVKNVVECFLRKCLIDENKFVRAWAYNGFYVLSMQYPDYIAETKQFFEMAMRDEAASVKARIRNIIKNDF